MVATGGRLAWGGLLQGRLGTTLLNNRHFTKVCYSRETKKKNIIGNNNNYKITSIFKELNVENQGLYNE